MGLRPVLKDTAIYGVVDVFFKAVAFFTFPIFAHVFLPSEYGLLALVTTVGMLVGLLFTCGLNTVAQLLYAGLDAGEKSYSRPLIVSTGLYCLTIFGIITVGSCIALAYIYRSELLLHYQIQWSWIMWGLLGNFLTQLSTFCLDVMRMYFKPWIFTFLAALQHTNITVFGLTAVLYFNLGLEGLFASIVVAYCILFPLCLWVIRQDLILGFDWQLCRQMVRLGAPFILTGVVLWLFGSMDRLMLNEMSTLHEVGLYSISFKYVSIMTLGSQAFERAWMPHALKMYKEDPLYRNAYSQLLNFLLFVFVFCAMCLSLFSEEFLMFTTPTVYWSAAHSLPFLSMGLACYAVTQVTTVGFYLEKKNYHVTIALCLAALCNVGLDMLLIPRYGAQGAAAATFLSYLIVIFYHWIFSQRIHPLPLEYRKLSVSLIAVFALIALQLWLHTTPWSPSQVLIKSVFLIAFIVCGFLFGTVRLSQLKPLIPHVS